VNRTKPVVTVVLMTAALVLGTVACGASDEDCKGDPGTVVEKDRDSHVTHTGTGKNRHTSTSYDYDLTIQRKDGSTYEKDVTSTAYGWYKDGSHFPSKKCDN
jgi:hypothetical protein